MSARISSARIIIRQAIPSNAHEIALLHARAWHRAYEGLVPDDYLASLMEHMPEQEGWYRELLEADGEWRTWVAVREESVVGFATTGPSRDSDAEPGTAEVWGLYLDPHIVGTGIGRALLSHAVEDLRMRGYSEATLWVLGANTRARRFYKSAGWNPDGATKTEQRPGFELHEVRYRVNLVASVS